jgi:hypothetical protein
VSLDDAEDVVEHEPPLHPDSVPPEIVRYRDALTYVQQLADHPHFRYEGHAAVRAALPRARPPLDAPPGRYRRGDIYVRNDQTDRVVYGGPDSDRPVLIDELVAWLNEGDLDAPVFVRAAMAHLNLVSSRDAVRPARAGADPARPSPRQVSHPWLCCWPRPAERRWIVASSDDFVRFRLIWSPVRDEPVEPSQSYP